MKQKLLRRWARFATRHPWWIIGALLVVTVVCAGLATRLKLNMRYADMLPDIQAVQRDLEESLLALQ